MPNANLIHGDDDPNTITGADGADLIYGFDPGGPQSNVTSIAATRVASGLTQPVFATSPADDFSRLFVVEKTGAIKILNLGTGQVQATPFLNVSTEVYTDSESGLLGLAFDPNFAQNGFFYVNMVINVGGQIRTEIRRYQVSANDPNIADPASATSIISIDQPFGNHKGGWLGFGPDGDLYASLGDGGSGGDPFGTGQNVDSLLGKMLRLDVHGDDFPNDPARNYRIPSDNPFVGTAGADEIWALGLRNPWRPGFDRGSHDLYIADVGQDHWEEIDIGANGANYGWNVFEGPDPYAGGSISAGTLTPPIYSYDHTVGHSITGGYVYRGPGEGLQGDYFFADFVAGTISTLHFDGASWVATDRTTQIHPDAGVINNVSSFGEDAAGGLYVVDFDGEVFRLTPTVTSNDQADQLDGLGGDDMMFGGSGGDTMSGGSGHDTLIGGIGDDVINGGPENDTLTGGPDNDAIDGGIGSDIASFTGRLADYAISYDPGANIFVVVDQRAGAPDGTDTVTSVERFGFSDRTVDANALTAETIMFADDSQTTTVFNAAGGFNWTFYTNETDANGMLTSQTVHESTGMIWVNEFDVTNAFSWSQRVTNLDVDANLYSQTTTNDDGSHALLLRDGGNLFEWSEVTVAFDRDWIVTSQGGLRDDATAMTAEEIGVVLDSTNWVTRTFDPLHDLIPQV